MQNFKNLKVWQQGMEIAKNIYNLTVNFPPEEKFGLASQMNRASVSIPSNIAEGASRKSQKEFHRFLTMALGLAFELETQLILCQELGLGNKAEVSGLIEIVTEEQKMLSGLMNKV